MRCCYKGAMIAFVLMMGAASARADFVIDNGQTVLFTQFLTNGQTGIVKPGGRILTGGAGIIGINNNTVSNGGQITTAGAADVGILVVNNNTINNTGTISTFGLGAAFGILGVNGNTISNAGTISTLGGGAHGITVVNNNTIFNSGSLSTTGAVAHGINAVDNNTIGNSGNISTTGISARGIDVGSNNTIGNSGTISTLGANAFGIFAGDNNTINNGGNISTTGVVAHGILANDNNTIVNDGNITTTGLVAHGVQGASNNTVVNSGFIGVSGVGSAAVFFTGGGNTLSLMPGSILVGPLDFAPGNTLDVANGLSINNTFTNNPPVVIANGAPFVANGLQVAVVDPTALALADDIFYDLTNTVTSSVLSRLSGVRQGAAAGQTVAQVEGDELSFASSLDMNRGTEGWVSVFGLARDQQATSPAVGADHELGGIVAGLDGQLAPDTRAGFFLGGSTGTLDVKFGSQDEDIDSVFGGVYGGYVSGDWAFDLVVTGGWSTYDLTRNVANNTAPGGVETASADYDGLFIAPEIAVSHNASINGQTVIPSVRLGYAGTELDGYTESGTTSGLTVDDRYIQMVTGRFQVTVPVRIPAYADTVYFAPYAGVEGRSRLDNSDVDAVLLGQTIIFDAGGEDSVGAVLAGAELAASIGDGMALFGRIETSLESNSGRTISGQAGLQITF